jgi:hypothetical protein
VETEAVSLLEDVDVEDIMDAHPVQQVKTIGDIAHTFQHLEWPSVAWAQLAPRPGDQGLSWPVKEPKPHPATDVELQGVMVGIVVALGVGLNLEQLVTNVSEEGVPVL